MQWVNGYREVIRQASLRFDIPPIALAVIAYREIQGDPDDIDGGVLMLREWTESVESLVPDSLATEETRNRVRNRLSEIPNIGRIFYPIEETSLGPFALQIRRAARALDYDNPHDLNPSVLRGLITSLTEPRQNIFIVAAYLSYIRDIHAPGTAGDDLSMPQLVDLLGRYYRNPYLSAGPQRDPRLDLPEVSAYGREAIEALRANFMFGTNDPLFGINFSLREERRRQPFPINITP
jgi:hypothetical protein